MRLKQAINYFSKLLNSAIDENTVIYLTSGQSIRAHAWLKENCYYIDGLNFGSGFTVSQLMEGGQSPLSSQLFNKVIVGNSDSSAMQNFPIGIDIQNIAELFPFSFPEDPKSDPELLSIYTIKELAYSQSKPNPQQTLTGIFAAKEAILKCSKMKINFTDLEILPDITGRPRTEGYSVSISHSLDYVIAVAICNSGLNVVSEIIEKYEENNTDYRVSSPLPNTNKRGWFIEFFIPGLVLILIIIELIRFLG